jgi:hypothetical protein
MANSKGKANQHLANEEGDSIFIRTQTGNILQFFDNSRAFPHMFWF